MVERMGEAYRDPPRLRTRSRSRTSSSSAGRACIVAFSDLLWFASSQRGSPRPYEIIDVLLYRTLQNLDRRPLPAEGRSRAGSRGAGLARAVLRGAPRRAGACWWNSTHSRFCSPAAIPEAIPCGPSSDSRTRRDPRARRRVRSPSSTTFNERSLDDDHGHRHADDLRVDRQRSRILETPVQRRAAPETRDAARIGWAAASRASWSSRWGSRCSRRAACSSPANSTTWNGLARDELESSRAARTSSSRPGMRSYDRFGVRGPNEMELASPRYGEDPAPAAPAALVHGQGYARERAEARARAATSTERSAGLQRS